MLTATVEKAEASVTLRVTGEVDMRTATVLADAVETSCWMATPGERLVLDLTGVGFFSGAGLSLLLETRQRCLRSRVPLLVVAPAPILRLLRITDLDGLFETVPADSAELTLR